MKKLGLTGAETGDALDLAVLMKKIVEEDLGLVLAYEAFSDLWGARVGTALDLEPDQSFGETPIDALTQAARENGLKV